MYREANAWQSSFFAPHDTEGLIGLYKSKADFEKHLDQLFSIPWNPNYIAENINSFIGQYTQGNQPDHGFAYLYYFLGKQEKSQAILNTIMSRFYWMGDEGRALCGMDDAGEMSSWYVFNAIGLYPYSPADPDYVVTVPQFNKVTVALTDTTSLTIAKKGLGAANGRQRRAFHRPDTRSPSATRFVRGLTAAEAPQRRRATPSPRWSSTERRQRSPNVFSRASQPRPIHRGQDCRSRSRR
jgi:putative alpha-1,2-mannosidase